ncbi:DUF3421 domain-containing protein [Polyangium jinanense]|uniref:DUF3421 domain-containing protein n=1 Tax=Polyangium jinanense TaxID=2829994 RepID=A0A9X3XE53_9BACT|nr:DUF3421 domain-containing protein [Polyangium jinanense]MDC3962439.1 DUF3421 domain-containing protein [Polyangium jinanense]MDC3988637.1 DUF3421 domain-containing protein [Polyangium jinanense]
MQRKLVGGLALLAGLGASGLWLRSAIAQPEGFSWVFGMNGYVPAGAIPGGSEPGRVLYICHGWYEGGLHPGKIVGQNCNIGWGGREVLLNAYEVLVGDPGRVQWVDASNGWIPPGAVSGGYESGRPSLYICRAQYRGWQPGKVVGENCNFGYGGDEKLSPSYQVLTAH